MNGEVCSKKKRKSRKIKKDGLTRSALLEMSGSETPGSSSLALPASLRKAIHAATHRPGRQQRTINHPPVTPAFFTVRPSGNDDFCFAFVLGANYSLRIGSSRSGIGFGEMRFEHRPYSCDQERGQAQLFPPKVAFVKDFQPQKRYS